MECRLCERWALNLYIYPVASPFFSLFLERLEDLEVS